MKKTCSIALMSGKGGSGKTTLALSMASLLSSCKIKTLLVDCDLSTNGATYFFEDEMAYSVDKIDTLHNLLLNNTIKAPHDISVYPVNEFFDFLPSVTKIGEIWIHDHFDDEDRIYLEKLFFDMSLNYDVILYDCQAGYTELLEVVVELSDRNLMVLEADSISASAVRNLFLKLNHKWNNKKIYQVFNKATKEEAEIYSKVTSGTIFDNLGCILFDWTVRRAFSTSQIPDMTNASIDYGEQVCDLCTTLIKNPTMTKKLTLYTDQTKLIKLKAVEDKLLKERQMIQQKISEEKKRKQSMKNSLQKERTVDFFLRIMTAFAMLLTIYYLVYEDTSYNLTRLGVIILILMLLTMAVFMRGLLGRSNHNKIENIREVNLLDGIWKLNRVEKDLEDIDKQITMLKEKKGESKENNK